MVRKRGEGTVSLVSRAISEGIQPNGFEEWLAKQPKDQVVLRRHLTPQLTHGEYQCSKCENIFESQARQPEEW